MLLVELLGCYRARRLRVPCALDFAVPCGGLKRGKDQSDFQSEELQENNMRNVA